MGNSSITFSNEYFLMRKKLTKLVFSVALLTSSVLSHATEIRLECIDRKGGKLQPITINLQQKTMKWGELEIHEVVSFSDKFITLSQKRRSLSNNVGGEYWLIDRYTGEFHRVSVGALFDSNGNNPRIDSYTQSGNCVLRKF